MKPQKPDLKNLKLWIKGRPATPPAAPNATPAPPSGETDNPELFASAMRGIQQQAAPNQAALTSVKPAPVPRPKAAAAPPTRTPATASAATDPWADFEAATPLKGQPLARPNEPSAPARRSEPSSEFARLFGAATPIDTKNRRWLESDKPAPLPRPTQTEISPIAAALSDEYPLPATEEDRGTLQFVRPDVPRHTLRQLRQGQWPIQASCDFHALTLDEARNRFAQFLDDCLTRQLRCIRLVHGKGYGSKHGEPVIKPKLRGWLIQRQEVLAFCPARPFDGGDGAVLVLLRHIPTAEQ